MSKKNNGSTTIANLAKHGYEATVKARARMHDTGISGRTTKALGRACGSCKEVPLSTATRWAAKSGGIWGGAISGGISGTALAGTALGTACVVAAPVAAAIGVGYGISKLWSAIWD